MVNSLVSPFLDNIGTVGNKSGRNQPLSEHQKRVLGNRYRGYRHSRAAAVNKRAYDQLNAYMLSKDTGMISTAALQQFTMLRRSLASCCKYALHREHHGTGDLEFMGAHTCDHKYCFVCNELRSRTVRRKFMGFFRKNPELLDNYDFMHLTLTVPHTVDGWRGKRFYVSELMATFNRMRKERWWKKMVYAGEFGVEITINDNGPHCHIHALLLVNQEKQSRNILHARILEKWNDLTADDTKEFQPVSDERWASIEKGNAHLRAGSPFFDKEYRSRLNESGATLIGLEMLYTVSDKPAPGYKYDPGSGKYKKRVSGDDPDGLMDGIMECIKYHFEPSGMLLRDGSLDFELLNEILPAIYKKPLYRKFGAFHTRTKNAHPDAEMLNFNAPTPEDEVTETLEEFGNEKVINPTTGEEVEREEYSYMTVAANKVFYDKKDMYRPILSSRVKRTYIHASNLRDALLDMLLMANPKLRNREDMPEKKERKKRIRGDSRQKMDEAEFVFQFNYNAVPLGFDDMGLMF